MAARIVGTPFGEAQWYGNDFPIPYRASSVKNGALDPMAALFTDLQIGGLRVANRIAVSPMCQYSAIDGVAQPWHRQHLGGLALSGAGLLIVEATAVAREGRITPGCLGLWNDRQARGLADLVTEITSYSPIAIGIQIGHTGRRSSICPPWEGIRPLSPAEGGWRTVAPSALPHASDWPLPRVLDRAGMDRVRDAFVAAARRARRAGFSLLELHAAHGYLLHQFLSPLSNRRDDDYGGSLQNRMRFPLDVAQAVREIWPRRLGLGMRISASDWRPDGWTLEDSVVFARRLKGIGIDYVCASSGGIGVATALLRDQLPFATRIRRETSITTCAVGQIVNPIRAEAILMEGGADFVALGRAFLDNPRWGWHAAQALGAPLPYPRQYELARPDAWRGFAAVHPGLASRHAA